MENMPSPSPLLGEYHFTSASFGSLETSFLPFTEKRFQEKNSFEKAGEISRVLASRIVEAKEPAFLLCAVVEYIARIQKEVLPSYTLSSFELWLNHFSHLSEEESRKIRGKIVGKWIPRDCYQCYFPIGMGKRYPGTHFVAAHNSPDLDTTVASFWGWVDAFGAQVGEGLHLWNIPGGPPSSQVEISLLFKELFGSAVFDVVAKTRLSLTLNSLDLMTQEGMMLKEPSDFALSFDQGRQRTAAVIVNKSGEYLGDWRSIDVEGVRRVVMALSNCLMWLESHLHIQLISALTQQKVTVETVRGAIQTIAAIKIKACAPAQQLSAQTFEHVHNYLRLVLRVEEGMEATFEQFARAMERIDGTRFTQVIGYLRSLLQSELFDEKGRLVENRPLIFHQLELLVKFIADAFQSARLYMDSLEVAFGIKSRVFGFAPQSITHRTEIEEIRSKMENYPHLTVNQTEPSGRRLPIGVIYSADLQKKVLGTVSLRDFCNREEMNIPSYLQVISVIDHHKSVLLTDIPPKALISDAQSSNTLVAQLAFEINDRYTTSGMGREEVEQQLAEVQKALDTPAQLRIYQRLLNKKRVFSQKSAYYISSEREKTEYLHFIYAILDDTDLLTKVSRLDVECVASLLNRLKSLICKREVEIVSFDDIEEDSAYTDKAARCLLQNRDFYSLYSKVYAHKEEGVEENLKRCMRKESNNLFTDTKILNYCNRVGQTKIFARNYPTFARGAEALRRWWYEKALDIYANNEQIMLHLHMVSTIASADALFKGGELSCPHRDELWFWVPSTDLAVEKLKLFLSGFKSLFLSKGFSAELELIGENGEELSQIFKESFIDIPHCLQQKGALPIAILRFPAGAINSRKGMVAPYLPRIDK